ncbi:MAG TPA: hypothetical protein VK992_00650, partial [Candidatus Caenarcaniphilales bacterium]|nr:hypothetical protein [Candidatus Caenarcaniphilales bacterium]
ADRGDVGGFRAAGVTRLSIGAQSMIPGELRSIGRRHAPDDVAATVALARRARMESVSVDLLYDLPDQTLDSWRRTLDAVLALEPDHVSAYALALDDPEAEGLTGSLGDHLPLSSGARRWRERARGGQDEDRAAACYREADERLAIAGLRWYELSNWGRPGHESRHNLCYWRRLAHEAVGPGAHAFDGALTRRWNGARIDRYLAALGPPGATARQLPPGASETVDVTTAVAERAILGLRLRHGLDPATADEPALRDALRWGESSGLLKRMADGSLRLTDRGRLLANELFVRLLPEVRVAAA